MIDGRSLEPVFHRHEFAHCGHAIGTHVQIVQGLSLDPRAGFVRPGNFPSAVCGSEGGDFDAERFEHRHPLRVGPGVRP